MSTHSSGSVPSSLDTGVILRHALRGVPQPVAVVSGLSPSGDPVGMTVSSFASVSLEPPLVLFCPAVTSRVWAAARGRGMFALNILGHDHAALALQFAAPGNRFDNVRLLHTDLGLPVLAAAPTVLVCEVRDELPAGDHDIVLAHVRAIHEHRHRTGLDTVSLRARARQLNARSVAARGVEFVAGLVARKQPTVSDARQRAAHTRPRPEERYA